MRKGLIFTILIIFLLCFNVFAEDDGSGVKKVLILPFEVYSQPEYSYLKEAIPEMLVSRLFLPSKIEIVDMEKVKEEVKTYEKINKNVAEDLGKKFGADYAIWGSVTVLGEKVSIDAQIMNLSGEKKPVQFFQEINNISEIISQLSRFAQKARMYIEGKEEDFYREPYYAMAPYGVSKEHPERGYYYYYPYLYPWTPVERKPKVTRGKNPYADYEPEGLTSKLVLDLSKGTIGWAEDEEEKNKNANATAMAPNYPPMYPPQPYYPYSPPPYYYYHQEDEGVLSKLWSRIWPFGEKENTPKYYTQVAPAPQPYTSSQPQLIPQPQPQVQPQPYIPPQTDYSIKKENPWSWE
jgi:TolB-like protein